MEAIGPRNLALNSSLVHRWIEHTIAQIVAGHVLEQIHLLSELWRPGSQLRTAPWLSSSPSEPVRPCARGPSPMGFCASSKTVHAERLAIVFSSLRRTSSAY